LEVVGGVLGVTVVRTINLPWRTGRKVGRTIYAQISAKPSDHDVLIGVMDTRALARSAVEGHNASLGRQS
jgi:hypothetical protein